MRALKIIPDNPYITDSLGWIYHKMGDNKNAAITLEKALKLAEQKNAFEPEIITHLISVYTELKQFEKIEQMNQDLLNSKIYASHRDKIFDLFKKL